MNELKFQEIKQKALDEHIPIIMDDTLEYLDNMFKDANIENILEIGTAVRIFCNMYFEIFIRNRKDRHNRKRWRKSKRSNRKY